MYGPETKPLPQIFLVNIGGGGVCYDGVGCADVGGGEWMGELGRGA